MSLTQNHPEIRVGKRLLIATACATIALAACTSAIALRMELTPAHATNNPPKKIHVKEGAPKATTQILPVYPPDAKKAGIEGTVLLHVLISKEGVPEHIAVVKGPKELRQSAIDSVKQWRWEPFLLNGDPIEVETTITTEYKLYK